MNVRESELLGVRIGAGNRETLLQQAMAHVATRDGEPFTFACANPHSLVTAQGDPEFRDALRGCSAVVADGSGVRLAACLAGFDVGPRITGMDFFLGLMSRLNMRGGRVFFLGSVTPVLDELQRRAARDFPRVHIDTLSPPFGEWSPAQQQAVVEHIRAAYADVLWVGMTAPKQEKWMHANARRCGVPVVGAIGAVFDYYAGTVRRAPQWICRLGFEWLYRLLGEPRRLWRRTLISAPQFLWLVFRQRLGSPRAAYRK